MSQLLQFGVDEQKPMHVLGIMSGTSCDGLDIALIRVQISGNRPAYNVLYARYVPYPEQLLNRVQTLIVDQQAVLSEITDIKYLLSRWISDEVTTIKNEYRIDLIGVHGQTIFHNGDAHQTWQLGSPQLIAKWTGIPTVGDFRTGDTAFNGQGAPLVSYFDFLCWNRPEANQLILNIGGISNGTFLPKDAEENDVRAFDFGPGNTLIDYLSMKYFNKPFDENGYIAKKGIVSSKLIYKWLKDEAYFDKPFPKSIGREYFNSAYCNQLIADCVTEGLSKEDIISTISAFTVRAIVYQLNLFNFEIDELYITGGGANNEFFRGMFKELGFELTNVSGDEITYKEAVIFALMAYYFILGKPANLPSVTGADRKSVMGTFSY